MHDPVADLALILATLGRIPPATVPADRGSAGRTHVYVLDDIVVKFDGRHGSASMVRERTALELLVGCGLPVPTFLSSGDFADGRRWVSVKRLEGEQPADALALAHEVGPELAASMGAVVARLHAAVTPPGFGTWSRHPDMSLIGEDDRRTSSLLAMGQEAELVPQPELDALILLMQSTSESLTTAPELPVLAHRDVQPRNVLVSADGAFSALIDFESSGGGDPAEDFRILGLDWTAPGFAAFVDAYAGAGGVLGGDAAERVAHNVLVWALIVFCYLGGIAPDYLPAARLAVERVASGERPDVSALSAVSRSPTS